MHAGKKWWRTRRKRWWDWRGIMKMIMMHEHCCYRCKGSIIFSSLHMKRDPCYDYHLLRGPRERTSNLPFCSYFLVFFLVLLVSKLIFYDKVEQKNKIKISNNKGFQQEQQQLSIAQDGCVHLCIISWGFWFSSSHLSFIYL